MINSSGDFDLDPVEEGEDKCESFHLLSSEEEPVMSPGFEERAKQAVKYVVGDELEEKRTNTCEKYCSNCCEFEIRLRKYPQHVHTSIHT